MKPLAEMALLCLFLGALALVGTIDDHSARVARKTALEAPRPIFEPEQMSMPCSTWIAQKTYYAEPWRPRCSIADLRNEED